MIKDRFLDLIRKYSDNENFNIECWNEIKDNYSSPSRHYHNLKHLENMLLELDKVKSKVKDIDTLLFAIFYHDIIYKTTKKDNEHQSALLFEKRISQTSFKNLKECMAQIEATKDHKLSNDNDTNILIDIDLSILGKEDKKYQKYCKSIRMEYHIYPDFFYRKGRKRVLEDMLKIDSIYKTDFFKQAYEHQARKNLNHEISQLS